MKDSMYDIFECASGSIIGRHHTDIGMNNQDSFSIIEGGENIVAVVCDGCSGGQHSEVGSNLGASMVASELSACGLDGTKDVAYTLERVRRLVVDRINLIVHNSGMPIVEAVSNLFLFTIVAAIVGRNNTFIISIGDGLYSINDNVVEIGPFENNAPPYIAYSIVQEYLSNDKKKDLGFCVNEIIPTHEVESLLIGTDGICDLIEVQGKEIPGKSELVGGVEQFWKQDLFFSNEFAVERRLRLINKESVKMDAERRILTRKVGHLRDDTTLISIRRRRDDSLSKEEGVNSHTI
jgi:hypothetical protein